MGLDNMWMMHPELTHPEPVSTDISLGICCYFA
jgi:hypothetical protein